jgi:hypothetical protein
MLQLPVSAITIKVHKSLLYVAIAIRDSARSRSLVRVHMSLLLQLTARNLVHVIYELVFSCRHVVL